MTTLHLDPIDAADLAASTTAYQAILDTYRDTQRRDLSEIVQSLPGDRLNRLAEACRSLGHLVEVEILRRNGVPSAAGRTSS